MLKIGNSARLRSALLAMVAAAALLVTGCTSSSTAAPRSSGSSAAMSTGTSVSVSRTSGPAVSTTRKSVAPNGLPAGVTPQSLPSSVANSVDKRKGVEVTGCAAVAGGWGAKGTAVNKGAKDVAYTITIFFTTSQATTIASAQTKITVKPGATGNWTVSAKFKAADTMLCVLRGVA